MRRRELTERARATAADVRVRLDRMRSRQRPRSGWHLDRLDYADLVRLRAVVLKAGGCPFHAVIDVAESELQALSALAAATDAAALHEFEPARLSAPERAVFAEIESRATGAREKPIHVPE